MRHRNKTIRFVNGKDANEMLLKKLSYNFLVHGKLTTTEKKAKVLKSFLEGLMEKTKERSESNKNYLLRYFPDIAFIEKLYTLVGPAIKEKVGGYLRVQKQYNRPGDGTMMAQVTWTQPIVWEEKKQVTVSKKTEVGSEPQSKTKKVAVKSVKK